MRVTKKPHGTPKPSKGYLREDGEKMVEIAPHVYLNEQAARRLGAAASIFRPGTGASFKPR
jgi:hypothetical protein